MKFILATTLFLASVMALPSQLAAAPHDGGKRDLVKESREAANEFCSGFLGYCSDTIKCCDNRICTRCPGDTAPINVCHDTQCAA
ncbi:hypothetical protein BCIN_12g06760 [Botrytis cinerea B05.10]|uniref:Uncharacterized protein n=2 Tax=Botryotinia fuckeliana TaxID=40559 RepID=A0A384K0T7_BOTFB|nr:hypothetical protein BCIN_12g06760 [Botrytis cinerea B05.10]ATZ56147.1 hypothetical protein BCIN_12g06760 [Botrytis cinerea B05.10]EMR88719.1 hypothetical protein BcDW1_2666 [Botrytis cinerea BcDW1]